MTIYCIAPKGESAEARAQRIRQYEDFFNASGMATPDDLEEFRSCQIGYMGKAAPWNDMSRGATHWIEGADENAEAIGLKPLMSGKRTEDEGLFVVQHKYWQETMRARPRRRSIRGKSPEGETDMTITFIENLLAFLYREARLLDDKEWEDWLQLYAPDVEFWMPAWDDDDTLVTRPAARDLADLVRPPGRSGGPRLPHQDRAVQRHQPAGAAHLAQHQQCRDPGAGRTASASCASTGSRFSYRYKTDRHLFRHVVLHARHIGRAAADQATRRSS